MRFGIHLKLEFTLNRTHYGTDTTINTDIKYRLCAAIK